MEYGLIGASLGHSFSKVIHEKLAGYEYNLLPLNEEEFHDFMKKKQFHAINVTIPYKQLVIPYCDEIDPKAKSIGAINTIVNKGGKLTGYNTDYSGFVYMLRRHNVRLSGKTVLILGNGGSAKTLRAVAQDEGAACVLTASRSPSDTSISYEQAAARTDIRVIINASPVGMYPNNGICMVDPAGFPELEAVFDLVYNPMQSRLLQLASRAGVLAVNGLEMLVAQAKYAAELFVGECIPEDAIAETVVALKKDFMNIVLVGMPGSGKTTLGMPLAINTGKKFIDTDSMVEENEGRSIPEIFAGVGEQAFREMETEAVRKAGAMTGMVIATGGGAILRAENIDALKQNGMLIYLDCPVEKLAMSDGRPLAKSIEDLKALYSQRYSLYAGAADLQTSYSEDIEERLEELLEVYNDYFGE